MYTFLRTSYCVFIYCLQLYDLSNVRFRRSSFRSLPGRNNPFLVLIIAGRYNFSFIAPSPPMPMQKGPQIADMYDIDSRWMFRQNLRQSYRNSRCIGSGKRITTGYFLSRWFECCITRTLSNCMPVTCTFHTQQIFFLVDSVFDWHNYLFFC